MQFIMNIVMIAMYWASTKHQPFPLATLCPVFYLRHSHHTRCHFSPQLQCLMIGGKEWTGCLDSQEVMKRTSNPAASYSKASALGHSLLSRQCYLPGETINWVWLSPCGLSQPPSDCLNLFLPQKLIQTNPQTDKAKANTLRNFGNPTGESMPFPYSESCLCLGQDPEEPGFNYGTYLALLSPGVGWLRY